MKRLILLVWGMVFSAAGYSQTTPVYTDDIESYPVGMGIAYMNPLWWATWNNQPGTQEDGIVAPVHASSGSQSVQIYDQPIATDLILKLGDRTTGKYDLNWKVYFEPGCGGHINIQHFETPGVEWALQLWFNGDGSGQAEIGGNIFPFGFAHGTWVMVQAIIDLDSDWIRLYIGNSLVHAWPFSYQANSTAGTNQLGGVDFFSSTLDGSTPKFFVDDVNFFRFQEYTFYLENFESYGHLDFIAQENPVWWKTWSNLPGTDQDGIVLTGFAHSGENAMVIDYVPSPADVVLKLGERTAGKYILSWYMYIQTSYGGYFNVQHFESVGQEFAYETWFEAGGTGYLRTGAVDYPFAYPKDQWFQVKNIIDLDNDWAELHINGIPVHQWPFSYLASGASGTNQLGGLDFYATTPDGSPPQYFIDDIVFVPDDPTAIPLSHWAVILAAGLIALSAFLVLRRHP